MDKKMRKFVSLLKDVLRRRNIRPSRLASELGICHSTVSRWISGEDIPSPQSCRKLAEYAGLSAEEILVMVGYLPAAGRSSYAKWPEFREYVKIKYPNQIDEDLVDMIEDLIKRHPSKNHGKKPKRLGNRALDTSKQG